MSSPAEASGQAAASQMLTRMGVNSYLNEHQQKFGGLAAEMHRTDCSGKCVPAALLSNQWRNGSSTVQRESLFVLLLEFNLSQLRQVESMGPRHFVRCICRGSGPKLLVFRK